RISLARLARFTCPPLRWRMRVARRWVSRTTASVSLTVWKTSPSPVSGGRRSSAVYRRAFSMASDSCRTSRCGTTAISCFRASKGGVRAGPVDWAAPAGRLRAAAEEVEQSALARPARAEQAHEFPRPNHQADAVQEGQALPSGPVPYHPGQVAG